jgi:hypothetical protein
MVYLSNIYESTVLLSRWPAHWSGVMVTSHVIKTGQFILKLCSGRNTCKYTQRTVSKTCLNVCHDKTVTWVVQLESYHILFPRYYMNQNHQTWNHCILTDVLDKQCLALIIHTYMHTHTNTHTYWVWEYFCCLKVTNSDVTRLWGYF